MKANVMKKQKSIASLFLMMFATVVMVNDVKADWIDVKGYVPVAICSTGGTHIPLPYFVCCELLDYKGNHVWRDTWVSTSCKNADSRATYDMGCHRASPVYGMGSSVMGNCQFSYSTGRYI